MALFTEPYAIKLQTQILSKQKIRRFLMRFVYELSESLKYDRIPNHGGLSYLEGFLLKIF